jgi:CheY-like chemotaxis protein
VDEQLQVTDNRTRNWQASIAVKITALILWALIIVVPGASIFLFNGIKKAPLAHYADSADQLALREQPDLILMDPSLPIVDGWQAARHRKSSPLGRTIPIIALTAHTLEADRAGARESGCDDFDTKPVELQRLLEKIEQLLTSPENAASCHGAEPSGPAVFPARGRLAARQEDCHRSERSQGPAAA